jgi:hypothetical protein
MKLNPKNSTVINDIDSDIVLKPNKPNSDLISSGF